MLWLLAAALPGAPLEAGVHVLPSEASNSLDERLRDLFHGPHDLPEGGIQSAAFNRQPKRTERHIPLKQPTKSSMHDLLHGKHEQAPAATRGKQGRRSPSDQLSKGMHTLFDGHHKAPPAAETESRGKHNSLTQPTRVLKEPPTAKTQPRGKRNQLTQPVRVHQRDPPPASLSKGMHDMVHGPHEMPSNLVKPEKGGLLGKLSVGMHSMLHGRHQHSTPSKSVSLRADRPRGRARSKMGVNLNTRNVLSPAGEATREQAERVKESLPSDDLLWGNELDEASNGTFALDSAESTNTGQGEQAEGERAQQEVLWGNEPDEASNGTPALDSAKATSMGQGEQAEGERAQQETAEEAAVRQERNALGDAEWHEREEAESVREEERAQTQREAEEEAEARRQQAMEANQKEKEELAEAKRQAEEEKEELRVAEEARKRQEGAITLVVLSDRVLPIQVCLGSVLMKTSTPLNIWVIGDDVAGLEETLKSTLPLKAEQTVRVMPMDQAEEDVAHLEPPWMSSQASRSVNNESWYSKHTVRLMDWDHDAMHHSRFNIMRFYIPYLSAFEEVDSLLFMDDDVIMTDDIRLLAEPVVPENTVLVGQCDNFAWQDQCKRYAPFVHGKDWTTNSATLYLQQNLTNTYQHQHCPDGTLCGPSAEEHKALLLQLYAEQNDGAVLDFTEQPVWNFGLVRLNSNRPAIFTL